MQARTACGVRFYVVVVFNYLLVIQCYNNGLADKTSTEPGLAFTQQLELYNELTNGWSEDDVLSSSAIA